MSRGNRLRLNWLLVDDILRINFDFVLFNIFRGDHFKEVFIVGDYGPAYPCIDQMEEAIVLESVRAREDQMSRGRITHSQRSQFVKEERRAGSA